MELFANLIVLGILAGAVYGLVGIGFTMVLGVARIANFAHGSLVVLGMYFTYLLYTQVGINPYVALLPGVVVFAILGAGMAALFRTRSDAAGETGELLLGLGFLLIIESGISLVAGPGPKPLNYSEASVNIFGNEVEVTKLIALGLAAILAVAVNMLIRSTSLGRSMQAVSLDAEGARIQGISVDRVKDATVAISVVIAGIAGIAISPFTVMTPFGGAAFLLSAFAVVVIGRLGSPIGALFAGLFIGIIQSLASGYIASTWAPLVSLGVVLVFLIVRPIRTEATS
jgi:branched-chain amino acid transport system permease protein